jgi:hypothetical protein
MSNAYLKPFGGKQCIKTNTSNSLQTANCADDIALMPKSINDKPFAVMVIYSDSLCQGEMISIVAFPTGRIVRNETSRLDTLYECTPGGTVTQKQKSFNETEWNVKMTKRDSRCENIQRSSVYHYCMPSGGRVPISAAAIVHDSISTVLFVAIISIFMFQ